MCTFDLLRAIPDRNTKRNIRDIYGWAFDRSWLYIYLYMYICVYICVCVNIWGQQHSFSTHEQMFLWKCLDLKETRTPNLRIHDEYSNHLSYHGQTFAAPCFWILALAVKIFFKVKLTFQMLTLCGQQHSFSTHKRLCMWKWQSFWDRKCLDLRRTWTPNLRIHTECSTLLSYQGQTLAVPWWWCWILAPTV